MSGPAAVAVETLTIEIGAIPVLIRTESPELADMLRQRYGAYVNQGARPVFEFDTEVVPPGQISDATDVSVRFESGRWIIERGDFYAEWDAVARRGRIRQSANPYSLDCVLRIVHTLVLAKEGGMLVHASSAIRNGRAFLFAGVSGAGKTTIARLAPADATLLTDEISYVRRQGDGYAAYGTPFAGDLGEPGANVQAPLAALHLLVQGPENRIEDVPEPEAARALLESILFFAHDSELTGAVFQSACDFVKRVPVKRLTFFPDERVWELIQ